MKWLGNCSGAVGNEGKLDGHESSLKDCGEPEMKKGFITEEMKQASHTMLWNKCRN